jgi:hypothetical protein
VCARERKRERKRERDRDGEPPKEGETSEREREQKRKRERERKRERGREREGVGVVGGRGERETKGIEKTSEEEIKRARHDYCVHHESTNTVFNLVSYQNMSHHYAVCHVGHWYHISRRMSSLTQHTLKPNAS